MEKWSEEKVWAWYKARPWISGFNFIPSGAMEGVLWMLQDYQHEQAFREAAKEIALASSLGLNSVRMFLPFELWIHQKDTFMQNLKQFVNLLGSYHMTLMPVLFNDCCVPKSKYHEPVIGPQPEPVPGHFGGTADSPFDNDVQTGDSTGYNFTDDPPMEPLIHEYVHTLAQCFGQDDRILIWNVWNEAGNSQRGERSVPMMKKVFAWLREENISQPLTADVWGAGADHPYGWLKHPGIYADVEREAIALSDLITFHFYGDYTHARQYITCLEQFHRPLINTEWMHRPYRSLVQTHLPLWKKHQVGSYFFGFVNGKAQFNYVWEFIKDLPDIDTSLWMHDIFHADFTPYDAEEIEVLKACNRDKNIFA